MEPNGNIIQYILKSQSFNEPDIAFIMHSMFKRIYKTDSKGQWYSLNGDGTWILKDTFDVRELIKTKVCTMLLNCIDYIKKNYTKLTKEKINTNKKYFDILTNLAEKRQLLRDQNRIDEECRIKLHIQRFIEYNENTDYNRVNFNTLDGYRPSYSYFLNGLLVESS